FRSSSQLSSSHGPGFAKLNRREGAGGWSPLSSDKYQWLEVDLGGRTQITSVSTQGRYGSSDWQTAYQLMFSDTGHNWRQYRWEGRIGAFPGNSNADSVVQHNLQHPVVTRFVRVVPLHWNPNGRIGLRLEAYGCPYNSDTVSFDGDSSLIFSLRPRQTSTNTIRLTFKTLRNSGFLLDAEGQNELGLTLELQDGQLLLSKQHLVSVGSLLDDQHWHRVAVEQHSSHFNLTVDKNTEWMTVGADQNLDSQNSNRNFHGCVENLLYDGQNLIDLAKQRDQSVTVMGSVTFSCSEPVFVAVTFTDPRSFLQLPGDTGLHSAGTSLGLQFRTWDTEGLLLTFDLPKRDGTVWLHLRDAKVHLQIHKAGRAPVELKAGSGLNDGQWHSVDLKSRQYLTVTVDGTEVASASPTYPIAPGAQLFYGGCPAERSGHSCRNPSRAFKGCMRLLTVEGELVDLVKVQQRLMGDYSDLQIDMCGIMDRCSPSYCEHGGSCTQSWSTFHCNCSSTGYGGATCHSSIYERSCEAYKHRGNTSGYYYIDADGSGPIKPQLLFCNMTDKTWTVIQHNNTELTKIQPSTEGSQHLPHFEYAADEEQLMATINQSEYCEQELAYHCRNLTPAVHPVCVSEGGPISWWVGGPGVGQRQTYWGGALPGSQQCACSLQENCMDPKRHCNGDADRTAANDSGLLTHKESLPVRSLVLRDVRRPGSESSYQVGPLRCYGDKSIWNAAFFAKETLYLHFPTFHGELSADISLLFKTTSSSGVLLENLGIRDFIRLELSSSTEVVFSFDVGNGPLEVSVKAGVPLNDNRWHRIQAERNVREASLRLDELPAATQEAPADGHIHLQLNSQLFVDVSVAFEPETSLSYSFKENLVNESNGSSSPTSSPFLPNLNLRAENISLSFRSGQSPALFLYVSSHHRQYLALLLNNAEQLEVRYRLESSKEEEILRSKVRSLANGQLHSVSVSRLADSPENSLSFVSLLVSTDSQDLDPALAQLGSLGFTGCLSAVLFNSISPLKAALIRPIASSVVVRGPLIRSSCGPAAAKPHAAENTHHQPGQEGRGDPLYRGQPLVNALRSDSALIGGIVAETSFRVVLINHEMGHV
uniref:Contactin-associated protein-like 4 n=1 Tax=Poecilia reticulata TaxID=8081 RepID=A0A3P9QB54_POERE